MSKTLKPATHDQWCRLRRALGDLELVIEELALAECPQSLKKAKALKKSLEGAERHMQRRLDASHKV